MIVPVLTPRIVHLVLAGLLAALPVLSAGPAAAQGSFSPVIRVNDKVITAYDIQQRARLLQALGSPGDPLEEAREALIDEKLQLQAAEATGLSLTEEGVEQGIEEFAGRANTTPENFLATLSRAGVDRETFIDFVTAGLLWRETIRLRFAQRARVSEDDVDRAVALASSGGGARVLLSEIILPARNAQEAAQSEERARQIAASTRGFQAFAAAARNFSASPSRGRGGRIDWIPLGNLPPQIRAELLTLPPGGVTTPLRAGNAIAVFQLRELQELPPRAPEVLSLDYAEFRIPDGERADAVRIANEIDTCDDLYGVAKNLPEDRLLREARPLDEIPADVREALATLDANEVSTSVRRGSTQLLVMLCGRTTEASEAIDRAQIRRQLVNQRIESYATGYLAELRSDAQIIELE
ncbi:peptidylprolyl isomerase [Ovoidimarina sediminis]|uniref:peptidylprolyl isomerase n=1 Tax=Ovoidimarina sediminis TaxID=3079856 RepID=UPI00290A22E8|nr:peptidylprolyl isomerase [Rhodophyticola sp. MJ-SS7]MDU8945656.1 peptidylprolyl isomerase [Rhodophyticola sp. MJ-SS7]